MFRVNDYQISFRKSQSLITPSRKQGQYDTVCNILDTSNSRIFEGYAWIHPNDSPNKIIGKKIALTRALENMGINKSTRTIVWKGFWEWVESWKKREHCIELVRGELAFCTVCKGGEGELTTECCGRPMTEEERKRVYEIGDLDFVNNKWMVKEIKCVNMEKQ